MKADHFYLFFLPKKKTLKGEKRENSMFGNWNCPQIGSTKQQLRSSHHHKFLCGVKWPET